MNEVLWDLFVALAQLACCWCVSGLLFSLAFFPMIMGPYYWARFRHFNLPRKIGVWFQRNWRLLLMWPFEAPRVVSAMGQRSHDEDVLYTIPACRLIGMLELDGEEEYFYQIGDRHIRGAGKRFFFCQPEDIVREMVSNRSVKLIQT